MYFGGCLCSWGAYSCMGAYYQDGVVVIEWGAYIHGVLNLDGRLLSRFYGIRVGTPLDLFSLSPNIVKAPL